MNFFFLFHNVQLHTQAYKKLQNLHSLPRIFSLARYKFYQIHALPYFGMAGLGSNLDHMNLN